MKVPCFRAWLHLRLSVLPMKCRSVGRGSRRAALLGMVLWLGSSLAPPVSGFAAAAEAAEGQRAPGRTAAIETLCQRLEIGPGAVIADVGCGEGLDSVVFARVVGKTGTVLAQEIDAAKLKMVVQVAGQRGLHQITPVLGQSDDPRLPGGLAHLIYLNRVFHHFAKPQAMREAGFQLRRNLPAPTADRYALLFERVP